MSVTRPYRRNCRPLADGKYATDENVRYILDFRYAKEPAQYIHAFLLIQEDFKKLLNYIHAAEDNLKCYSFRIHELFMRTCIEVEANFKAVLLENGYSKEKTRMQDYFALESTHLLSQYQVKIPHWRGGNGIRYPFKEWHEKNKWDDNGATNISWYSAYNDSKHNRLENFHHANFGNLLDAVCGLLVILSSQFQQENFSSGPETLVMPGYGPDDGMTYAIGNYFRINFPEFPVDMRYCFNNKEWEVMERENDPFNALYVGKNIAR